MGTYLLNMFPWGLSDLFEPELVSTSGITIPYLCLWVGKFILVSLLYGITCHFPAYHAIVHVDDILKTSGG